MFRVVEGGLSIPAMPETAMDGNFTPSRDDLRLEAERRIKATGYETWRNRESLTGIPVPRDISYLAMQIRYTAEAIGRRADVPADFRSDIYWPA